MQQSIFLVLLNRIWQIYINDKTAIQKIGRKSSIINYLERRHRTDPKRFISTENSTAWKI